MADTVLFSPVKCQTVSLKRTVYCLLFMIHILSSVVDGMRRVPTPCGRIQCYRGTCVNESSNTCSCDEGWSGPSCDSCGGRIRLNSPSGYILDGYGNYTLDTKCSWLIEGPPNVTIRLRFDHFATECSWDHLYIYDGNSVYSKLIAVLSGLVLSENQVNRTIPELTAHSGSVYLHFYSDAAYNMSGFNITYSMFGCPLECSRHGACRMDSFVCDCYEGWKGAGCDIPMCPRDCSGQGRCENIGNSNEKHCVCYNGFRGEDCSLNSTEGVWEVMETSSMTSIPSGRASHKTVVQGHRMWLVSGDSFTADNFQELARFNFQTEKWTFLEREQATDPWPEQRYGHSLVLFENKLYMFGGLKGNIITQELWVFSIQHEIWQVKVPQPAPSELAGYPNQVIGVVGHTAHVVDGIMYVIFGHSPIYGYVNTVQECNLQTSNLTWKIVPTSGAIVKGGYGHSSVYDPHDKQIYVHAGYHSASSSSYYLSDSLYSYDPIARHWVILKESGQFKYLHSAVIVSGLMLVFGGNTHNDTSISRGAKCYSTDFLAYDMECNEWYVLEDPHLLRDISRFGHTAEVYNNAMYVFGGFNGLMLHDFFKYTPGSCEAYTSQAACLAAVAGVRCVWSEERSVCKTQEDADNMLSQKVISTYNRRSCNANSADVSPLKCPEFKTCPSCVENSYACIWCDDGCKVECSETDKQATSLQECSSQFDSSSLECPKLHNCHSCVQNLDCTYDLRTKKCNGISLDPAASESSSESTRVKCPAACHTHSTCENCTSASCMWCSNQKRCVESNSYVASFPYGQCMEWTTQRTKCEATRCADLQTCEECQKNPACGWCDDGENMGLGGCTEGGADGPMDVNGTLAVLNQSKCPKERWFFVECPMCQCNGHSTCLEGTGICMNCADDTTGDQCEICKDGYYGVATNGGNCTQCECNGQADSCDRKSGKCFCHTRGVTGDHCDMCDEPHKYVGNPKNGTCFYNLQIDFSFTFNLSKEDDRYFTQINFINVPPAPDRDVDFNINCTSRSFINITVKGNSMPTEQVLVAGQECTEYKNKFSHKEHTFGREENTTFYVYLYDFQTPFSVQISFSQFPQIDLVHFFVTFFSCFLSLLLLAAIFWKVKQRHDFYQRRQRIIVEMAQMASRPFAVCPVEIPSNNPPIALKKEPPDLRASRRKKSNKPSPIALEPLYGQKAAILSLLILLPTGDEDYTPPGQTGLVVGSSIVTLGNPRKTSVEHIKGDRIKCRKTAASTGPENCL